MRYVYRSDTGEYIGTIADNATTPQGFGSTSVMPPSPNPNSVIRWDGTAWVNSTQLFTSRMSGAIINRLWEQADQLVNTAVDHNARARYLAWLVDPATSQAKRTKILAVQAWTDQVWMGYRQAKDAVLAGNLGATLPTFDPCPHTFWNIAETP